MNQVKAEHEEELKNIQHQNSELEEAAKAKEEQVLSLETEATSLKNSHSEELKNINTQKEEIQEALKTRGW